jgi:nitrous oxidase accessory protein NosD
MKAITIRGIGQNGVGRVLIQPAGVGPDISLSYASVIEILYTQNVSLVNLTVDASANKISGCSPLLSGIHFYDSSGTVDSVTTTGTSLSNQTSCTTLFPGNGFGIEIDQASTSTAVYNVEVRNSSISDFSRSGILATGAGITVNIQNNWIAGIGPSTGVNQFGVFLANGAAGRVAGNTITQGNCGSIAIPACFNLRSEGVVLRSVGGGVVVENNVINNVQAGVFINGANKAVVTGNSISNVDALNAIHIQGSTSGLYENNRIFHVGPFTTDTAFDEEGCGINDVSGTSSMNNQIHSNSVADAYCGVAYVTGDQFDGNSFVNTLYETLNGDNYPDTFPPPVEPGQTAPSSGAAAPQSVLKKVGKGGN